MAHGMPRLDLMRATERADGYRAGFWGLARIGRAQPGEVLARAAGAPRGRRATREAGARADPVAEPPAPLAGRAEGRDLHGDVRAAARAVPRARSSRSARRPDGLALRRRRRLLGSRPASPRCASARRRPAVRAVAADRRRGFYRNFERALALAPAGARYVALADQDDAWHPDKLETLLARDRRRRARLQRPADRRAGRLGRRGRYWEQRANNHADMLSLLVANCVTGAASLFPRELLDDALPFPPAQFAHFHDHWLALTALALGEIRYVDRPLYDYVQHGSATLGHANATSTTRLRERLASPPRPARADPAVADALLRRRLPADAVRRRAGDALRRRGCRARTARARPVPARRPLGGADRHAGGARAARPDANGRRDARRRVDALLRVRLAAPAGAHGARPPAAALGSTPSASARSTPPAAPGSGRSRTCGRWPRRSPAAARGARDAPSSGSTC